MTSLVEGSDFGGAVALISLEFAEIKASLFELVVERSLFFFEGKLLKCFLLF